MRSPSEEKTVQSNFVKFLIIFILGILLGGILVFLLLHPEGDPTSSGAAPAENSFPNKPAIQAVAVPGRERPDNLTLPKATSDFPQRPKALPSAGAIQKILEEYAGTDFTEGTPAAARSRLTEFPLEESLFVVYDAWQKTPVTETDAIRFWSRLAHALHPEQCMVTLKHFLDDAHSRQLGFISYLFLVQAGQWNDTLMPHLREGFQHGTPAMRETILEILRVAADRHPGSIRALRQEILTDQHNRDAARQLLLHLYGGEEARANPDLLDGLPGMHPETATTLLELVFQRGWTELYPEIFLMAHNAASLQDILLVLLQKYPVPEGEVFLIELLTTVHPEQKKNIVPVLALYGGENAIQALGQQLGENHTALLDEVVAALRKLTGASFGYEFGFAPEINRDPITKWQVYLAARGVSSGSGEVAAH